MFQLRGIWVKRPFFLLILLAGIILRLCKWNGYSFWYDETGWLFMCRNDLLTSLKQTVAIAKPPFFRFLLYFWTYISQDEFILRLLPFIFGILSILAIYKVGKMLFDKNIGLIAAFLVAFSPFQIYYSQELTHYSLTMLVSLYSIYYLIHSLKENKLYFWIMYAFFTSLCLYTHYLCTFLFITQNLYFFLSFNKYKNLLKRWSLSQLVILLLYFPWIMMLPKQFRLLSIYFDAFAWIPKGSLFHMLQLLLLFNVGYNANFIVNILSSLLFFPLFLIGVFFSQKRDREKINLLMMWLFFPMILAILFSKIQANFTYRNFIFISPAYYLLIANGITKARRYFFISIFSFIILSGLSLFNYYRNIFPFPEEFYRTGVHPKIDNRSATKYIVSNFEEGDIVFHTCISTMLPYVYYKFIFSHKNTDDIMDFVRNFLNFPKEKENIMLYDKIWEFPGIEIINKEDIPKFINSYNKRIWLVLSFWEPKALVLYYPFMVQNEIKQELDSSFIMLDSKEFEGIKVYLYKIGK